MAERCATSATTPRSERASEIFIITLASPPSAGSLTKQPPARLKPRPSETGQSLLSMMTWQKLMLASHSSWAPRAHCRLQPGWRSMCLCLCFEQPLDSSSPREPDHVQAESLRVVCSAWLHAVDRSQVLGSLSQSAGRIWLDLLAGWRMAVEAEQKELQPGSGRRCPACGHGRPRQRRKCLG